MGGKITARLSSKITALLLLSACVCISSCRQIERPFIPEPICPKSIDLNFDQCPSQKKCTDIEKCRLIERLEMRHVKVFRVGEDMRVVIPSDLLFEPRSANLSPEYQHILDHIATLIHCYVKVDIRVAGYTDCWGDPDHNHQLSLLQAQAVTKYLWHQGIDTRLIYSKGFGDKHPIASNRSYYSRARNRRIEITFRDIPHMHAIRGVMMRDMEEESCANLRKKGV